MLSRYLLGKTSGAYFREFFTTSGNWICPAKVTQVSILIMSSGLKGAKATSFDYKGPGAGGKGGFYYYAKDYIVVPGQSYPVTVGGVCSSTSVRNTSDFNRLVANNNLSAFTSYNTAGGNNGSSGQWNNAGVDGVKADALKITPIIKDREGECIDMEFALVDTICYGGSSGNWFLGQYGSSPQSQNGGEGYNISILDLSFNTNGGYGCGGKGGEAYQYRLQNGNMNNELREGQNGGQGLVTLLYYK